MSGYNIIFIGSPIWKGDLSLPVKSFLLNNDLRNKTIIPFYTFGGLVNKAKLDNEIKKYTGSEYVLPSFLTTYYKFSLVNFRLNKWMDNISKIISTMQAKVK